MIEASGLKRDNLVKIDGEICQVVESSLNKMGLGGAIVTAKVKNLKTGAVLEKKFRSDEKVEDIFLDKRDLEYLYRDGGLYVFMDTGTYDQYSLAADVLVDQASFLVPNIQITARFHDGRPLRIQLPTSVELKVETCDPSIKGATASAQYKPAICETGLKVTVPPFISPGDVISVDTRDGKYLNRVSK